MTEGNRLNQYQQPIGAALPDWRPRPPVQKVTLAGRFCRLEPLSMAHGPALFVAWHRIDDGRDWTYFSHSRPETRQQCDALIAANAASQDPLHFAVIDLATDRAVGSVALMRVDVGNGVLEIGWVNWSPLMKRSSLGTEAIFLLLGYTFNTLGYRRCEWKCHSLNLASNQAATRLGFQFEGTFRQALVVKGHNRDTCWYSIIDSEWPAIAQGLGGWLAPENFDRQGQQRKPLAAFRPGSPTQP